MTGKHFVGEIGTEIIVNCGVDLSSAIDVALNVQKPDGTFVVWTPSVYKSRSLRYVILADDLDLAGRYKIQSAITLSGWTGLGETDEFVVSEAYT